jgi:hypothetical protein
MQIPSFVVRQRATLAYRQGKGQRKAEGITRAHLHQALVRRIHYSIPEMEAQDYKARRKAMKSFHWSDLLREHPIFSSLSEEEITLLLRDDVSLEKNYAPDSIILRQGDTGDSIFLLGSGSVQVTVSNTPVAVLDKGEIMGEIAVLERKPRSATVTAREHCVLLEIGGEEFRKLLAAHTDIHTKVQAKMSARLNQAN